jgi:hypothetical protein
MKTKPLFVCSLTALMAFGVGAAAADPPKPAKVIESFDSEPLHEIMPQQSSGWGTYYQSTGDVIGGVRQTNLVADDTIGGSSRIDIEGGRMLVSTGIGSFFGAFLVYGYDTAGNDADMHENFEGYDYFQIDFERNDLGLVYLIEVWDGQGGMAMLANTLTTEAQSGPYSAKLPLSDFQGDNANGTPQAIAWEDIRYLIVYFQSASASGANDFSVTSVSAVDDPAIPNEDPAAANE